MKTINIMNFKTLSNQLDIFKDEFLKEGEKISSIEFTDDFIFKNKRSTTWGTDTICKIRVDVSTDKIFGDRTYKNIGDVIPEWKLCRESLNYRDID